MKKICLFLFILLLSSCQKKIKLGYVDRSFVINNFKKKINIEERFEVKNTAFIKKRDSLIEDYQTQRKSASLRSKKMTPEQVQKLSLEFQQKEAFIGQQIQIEQQELQQAFDAEIDAVIKEVKDFVAAYGQENDYTFIFGTSEATNSVMYSKEAHNISEIVLQQLNASVK